MNDTIEIRKAEKFESYVTMTYDIKYQGPGLGQTQTCDRVKSINEMPSLPSI
jgi:hypothetical protein